MSSFPLISVIIPTYNRFELLLQAVDSCLIQDISNLEIIIVDDGSSDGTQSMVEARLAGNWKDRSIQYVLQDNAGASSARNHGLSIAKGDYVQFLDSDDELLPGKLRKQIDFLEQPENQNCPFCYCYGKMGKSTEGDYARIGIEAATVVDLLGKMVSRSAHVMQTSAPLWRRSFLVGNQGWDEEISLGDDLEYHVRLVCAVTEFGVIPNELFFVREHQASRLSRDTMTRESLLSVLKTQESVFTSLYTTNHWSPNIKNAFLGKMRIVYANCLHYGNREDVANLESWLRSLGLNDPAFRGFSMLMVCRRILGTNALLFIHQLLIKLRKVF